MDRVFVYWDNSNVFHEARRLAEEREGTPGAGYLIRIHFENLLRLAEAGRPLAKAVAAGSVPPEMRQLWNRMENRGVQVTPFDRGEKDRANRKYRTAGCSDARWKTAGTTTATRASSPCSPATARATPRGRGFHRTLERMHRRGWRVEVLSWAHSCNRGMRRWAEANGVFVPLDDHYEAITFREPSRPGHEFAPARDQAPLDLSRRRMA